jgi:hypothetical protein
LALDGVPRNVATPVPSPETPVLIGRPVALVSVPEDGVPSAPPLTTNDPAEPVLTPSAVTTPVPVETVLGAAPAPPPTIKLFANSTALVAILVVLEKYGIPPLVTVPLTVTGNARPEAEIVLQPNPVLVVQIRAFEAPEQEGMAKAVGDALPAVPLPTTVLAVCVASAVSGIVAVSPCVTTVLVMAGSVRVKFDAPAFALASAVVPVDDPLITTSLLGKVCAAPHVCAVPSTATVSVAAGNVRVKLLAELAAANVSTPPPEEVSLMPLAGKVLAALKVCARPRVSKVSFPEIAGMLAVKLLAPV